MSAKSVADKIRELLDLPGERYDEIPYNLEQLLKEHPELERVGQEGMVVIPDGPSMTEFMIDASRKVWLYFTNGDDGRMTYGLLKHLAASDPRAIKWLPEWVFESNHHVTKAGCADLAHTVTVNAYLDPEPEKPAGEEIIALIKDEDIQAKMRRQLQWYNTPPEQKQKIGRSLSGRAFQKFFLELKDASGHVEVAGFRAYPPIVFKESAETTRQQVSIHIARHEMPKAWQKLIGRKGGKLLFCINSDRVVTAGPYIYPTGDPGVQVEKLNIVCTKLMGQCGLGDIEFKIRNGDNGNA